MVNGVFKYLDTLVVVNENNDLGFFGHSGLCGLLRKIPDFAGKSTLLAPFHAIPWEFHIHLGKWKMFTCMSLTLFDLRPQLMPKPKKPHKMVFASPDDNDNRNVFFTPAPRHSAHIQASERSERAFVIGFQGGHFVVVTTRTLVKQ